ncbi:MAG: hypothetical protein IJZ38_02655 [Bacteroides sp.]|nr:hypothetical protein [Bacteroides sp.]
MKAEIQRLLNRHPELVPKSDSISGRLVINGIPFCDTAENTHTALPVGEYPILRHYCKQYNRYMPVIGEPRCAHCQQIQEDDMSLNTTMPCVCPMLKPGNGVHHRKDGSIILGTQIVHGCLSHPLDAFNPLAERIRKAIKRNTVITLKITEL